MRSYNSAFHFQTASKYFVSIPYSEDGQVGDAFEEFGAKREGQPNRFNPVYDEDKDFDLRVQNEARAPFELDNLRPFAANSAAK